MSSDECNLFRKNGTISFAIKSTSFSNHVGRSKLNCKWWIQSWAAVWARVDLGFFVEPAPMDFWAKQRCERIDRLTSSLYFALIHDDGGLFVGKTGSLVSGSNLRTRRNQKIFDIILDAEKGMSSLENDRKRFWTKKIMFESIRSLVSKYNVQVPQVPGFSWTNWFKDQSSTLHELVKRAKRNRRNMDCLQTLPFNPEEPQHVLDLLCDSKVPSLISTFLWSITFCSTNNFRCLIAHVMLGIYLGGPTQRILCSQESIEQCQVEIATQEVPWIKSTGTAHVYFFSTDRWFSNSWLTWLTKQIQNKRSFWQSTRRSPRLQPLLRRRTVGMKMKRIFRNVLRKKTVSAKAASDKSTGFSHASASALTYLRPEDAALLRAASLFSGSSTT